MKAPPVRFARISIRLALVAGVIGLASPALARPRVAVLPFQGPAGERVRGAVVSGLATDFEVVSLNEIRRAAGSVNRPMGPAALWQVVSRRLNLSAVIKGKVTGGRRWQARLVVNQAETGTSVGSVVISDRRQVDLVRQTARTAPPRLVALVRKTAGGPALARRGRGAPGEQVAAGGSRSLEGGTTDASDGGDTGDVSDTGLTMRAVRAAPPAMLEASIGPRAIFRTLTFSDNYSGVPGYRLPGAPGVAGEVSFFPAARMGTWASNIGVVGAFESTLGATTQNQGGAAPSPTRHLGYRVGLRSRVPVAFAALLLGADYGEQHFILQLPEGAMSPESHYGFVRPTVSGRVTLGRLSFELSGGYLHILDAAGLTAAGKFPRATIRGGDAATSVAYAFDRGLQVQVGADYRRYAYTMNAQQGDALLVGGALDEYLGLSALLTYRFR